MADEAKRRQVIPTPDELQGIERSPLGAEVLFWVMEMHTENGNPRDASRIAIAEAVFKRVAEDKPDTHGATVPGCCHTCGGHLRPNHRGHDDAKGPKYEGRTREACYELTSSSKSSRQQVRARSVLTWRSTSEGNTKAGRICWEGWGRVCPSATWTRTALCRAGPGSMPTGPSGSSSRESQGDRRPRWPTSFRTTSDRNWQARGGK